MNTYKYFDMEYANEQILQNGSTWTYITKKQICQGMYTCVTFDENSFTDAACTLKLQVINPSYLKKLHWC